jgi:hypothetical protein
MRPMFLTIRVIGLGAMMWLGVASASAAVPSPGWTVRSIAEPTNFSSADNSSCEGPFTGSEPCDSYRVVVLNTGSTTTTEPVTISDLLPVNAGLTVKEIIGEEQQPGEAPLELTNCTVSPLRCTDASPVAPGDLLVVTIRVLVGGGVAPEMIENSATVDGGGPGVEAVSTTEPGTTPNTVNGSSATLGIAGFELRTSGMDGLAETQAGGHPFGITTGLSFTSVPSEPTLNNEDRIYHVPPHEVKNVAVDLPLGLVGDAQSTARCSLVDLPNRGEAPTACPPNSRVGTVVLELSDSFGLSNSNSANTSALYNLTPEHGYPAEFGFTYQQKTLVLYASVVRVPSGYDIRVAAPGVARAGVNGVTLTFFGDPAERDAAPQEPYTPAAFLTNPVDCSSNALRAGVEVDSWEEPDNWVRAEAPVYKQITGCEMLQFQPTIEAQPESTTADTPSGYEINMKVPQNENALSLATPELENASVTLPEGVSVSPSAADGLVGCRATGPEGIDIPTGLGPGDAPLHPDEAGEGEEIGPDGLSHLAKGHCSEASRVGTVRIATPLLAHELEGHVYVAQPECDPCSEADAREGRMLGIYLEAEGSGVVIKLKGTVRVNTETGQLTTTFTETPQLPFSELRLKLNGGPRAPLANPQTCGTATTTTELVPWSSPETPSAAPSWAFAVTGCGPSMPFGPSFTAGTVIPQAGGFSPFTMTLQRGDGEQDLSGVSVTTPPGLLGRIAEVPLCGEPQAHDGTCSAASQIGTAHVAAGAGSAPFWLTGRVYLTGAYRGAPYGLSIVVPTEAGPYNLGDEVVRAAIAVNPRTAQLTVSSDPLPLHKDGVPFRIQTINVAIDRSKFVFNPTNCEQLHVTGTVSGALPSGAPGSSASVSSPFAASGCANLPFNPSFKASTKASAKVNGRGAPLTVQVAQRSGEANIRSVHVVLPKQLPSRLSTLHQACLEATFDANPASCPAGSVVGSAVAHTPILPVALEGPAYFVSHGSAKFPELIVVLQGYGTTIELAGETFISKQGITSSTFATVPDAPISSFELRLPERSNSALAALRTLKKGLCGQKLNMPLTIFGQNGARVKRTVKISITGCPKHRPKSRRRR